MSSQTRAFPEKIPKATNGSNPSAGVLGQARQEVQLRQLCHFFRADQDYGTRVAQKLGINLDEVMASMGAQPVGA